MVDRRETDQFLSNERRKSSPRSAKCHTRWWNQEYDHQKFICGINESFPFHALIIFLVILDTSLVISEIMLDSFKIQHECKSHMDHNPSKHLHDKTKERIIHAMEIVHYCSIGILSFFFVELLVRIYAQGKEFWNIRRKKMEYLDAFIVITSLIIDLLFLTGEQKLLGEKLLLILVFRLWRFIRIISSVTEAIRHGHTKHKLSMNGQYFLALRRFLELAIHKTDYLESNKEDINSVLEHFRMIDAQLKTSLDALHRNNELTGSEIVAQFIEDLEGLENKNNDSVISSMFAKPSEA